ncbi:MAG: glycoside hydrolase family 43 protein [Treponema sp.]|nr:glycoside hydrolase family 43 protein [Treponema sp.]
MTRNLTYKNPSTINGIGDPFVLRAQDGAYYCYPTGGGGNGFRAWKSTDFVEWKPLGIVYDSLQPGFWASSKFWAPEVVYWQGKYYMYYTGNSFADQSLRIGLAISEKPEGPFIEALKRPLFDFGYSCIDANVLIDDDGQKYLYYSRDCSENIVNGIHESWIYGVRLADNMQELEGDPVLLTKPEQEWEKRSGNEYRWNEGAHVIKHDGKYYLIYSGNFYGGKFYSLGYAVSGSPLGPFVKYSENPILEVMPEWTHISGPGHNSVFKSPDGTELWVAYHTHMDVIKGGGNRQMAIDKMGFRPDGTIYINGPSLSPMPLPSGTGPQKNLALTAKVTVSSGSEKADALTDGEIGFNRRFGRYNWIAGAQDKSPTITLEWEKPVDVYSVMVYRGSPYEGNPFEVSVSVNKHSAEKITFPEIPGAAAVLDGEKGRVTSVTIKLSGGGEYRLSEIVILGTAEE